MRSNYLTLLTTESDTGYQVNSGGNDNRRTVALENITELRKLLHGASEQTDNVAIPDNFALHQNYPNPFNPVTTIRIDLPVRADVRLSVYNILGQEVARLVDSPMQAGYHTVQFDASTVASGLYFYRIQAGEYCAIRKMVLIK